MNEKEAILEDIVKKINEIHVSNPSYLHAHEEFINTIISVFSEYSIDPNTVRVQHDGDEYNLIIVTDEDGYQQYFIKIEVESDKEVMATEYQVIEAKLKNIIKEIQKDELRDFFNTKEDMIRFLEEFICVYKYPQLALYTNWTEKMEKVIFPFYENENFETWCHVTYKLNCCETASSVEKEIYCGRLIESPSGIDNKYDFLLSYDNAG